MGLSVDVFVLVKPCDFGAVLRCVQSVRGHLAGQVGRICIVTAALPIQIRQTLENLGCEFLNEADGLAANTDASAADVDSGLPGQFLKWELRRFSTTATYLVIEADFTLSEPVNLMPGDRPVLFCENRYRFGYAMCFNYFFGQIPAPVAPASARITAFDCATVEEIVQRIQTRWKAPWPQATLAIMQQVRGTAFDASQIYADYLEIFCSGRGDAVYETDVRKTAGDLPGSWAYLRDRRGGVMRMATLGTNGRFANQIFQYAFLRWYARREGLTSECPPWIGGPLFGHQAVLSENELPVYREDKGESHEIIRFDPDRSYRDFEVWGYFQDPRYFAGDRQFFRDLFEPLPFLKKPLDDAIDRLRAGGKTLVAIHLRRGDFSGGAKFWPAPEAWYLRWLEKVWPSLANPVLYIATDDAKTVMSHFAAYQPKSAIDLNVTVNGAAFYPDFYLMSQCDLLGISNSTFSFAAAMMNTTANSFVRPDPAREEMVGFDPWTSAVQLKKLDSPSRPVAA